MSNIIVVSGPSGSGKSTLVNHLLKEFPQQISFLVSHTTRERREHEQEGKNYFFVNPDTFQKMIKNKQFVEWAKVHNNFYGTTFTELEHKTKNQQVIILDIDVQGATILKEKYPKAVLIFILPPSMEELKKRLHYRNDTYTADINLRMKIAKNELKYHHLYHYVIVNNNFEDAYTLLKSIYLSFINQKSFHQTFIKKLLEEL